VHCLVTFAAWLVKSFGRGFFGRARRQLREDFAGEFLDCIGGQIFLKFAVDVEGILGAQHIAENHVAQSNRMRQKCVFLQLFESYFGVKAIVMRFPSVPTLTVGRLTVETRSGLPAMRAAFGDIYREQSHCTAGITFGK